jgi:hypothetical protein
MNKSYGRTSVTALCLVAAIITLGCSTNMRKKAAGGAAVGSLSASFVGAATDLILHGKVNTDHLAHNMVSGAVGGATAGAVVAHKEDKQTEKNATAHAAKELEAKIGSENYSALNDLLNYQYADAYAKTLNTVKSRKKSEKEAALIIQALVDKDRGNKDGMQESLAEFVKLRGDEAKASKGLDDLHGELKDMRKIQGIRKP